MSKETLAAKAREVLVAMDKAKNEDGIWVGKLTEFIHDLGYSPFYSRIVAILKASGAAEQLFKGAMGQPSRWRVLDLEADLEATVTDTAGLRRKGTTGALEARITTLEESIGGLNVVQAIAELAEELRFIRATLTPRLESASLAPSTAEGD